MKVRTFMPLAAVALIAVLVLALAPERAHVQPWGTTPVSALLAVNSLTAWVCPSGE